MSAPAVTVPAEVDEWRRLIREVVTIADRLHKLRVNHGVIPDRADLMRLTTALDYLDGARFGDPRCSFPGPEPKIPEEEAA